MKLFCGRKRNEKVGTQHNKKFKNEETYCLSESLSWVG